MDDDSCICSLVELGDPQTSSKMRQFDDPGTALYGTVRYCTVRYLPTSDTKRWKSTYSAALGTRHSAPIKELNGGRH